MQQFMHAGFSLKCAMGDLVGCGGPAVLAHMVVVHVTVLAHMVCVSCEAVVFADPQFLHTVVNMANPVFAYSGKRTSAHTQFLHADLTVTTRTG